MKINTSKIDFLRPLTKRKSTKSIVIHHSASGTAITLQDINRWHLANGWSGIGYHYVIYADGQIWTGRPENTVGAHAYYTAKQEANSNGIGICLIGNFETGTPTQAQLDSLVWLIKDIRTRYPGIAVQGHKDVMPTACPGKNFPWTELCKRLEEVKKVMFKTANDIPDWGKPTIDRLIAKDALQGDGKGNINLSEDATRILVILDRLGVLK